MSFWESQRLLRLWAPKHQRFELMDAPKGFLLNHLDGQGLGCHARRLLRAEKRLFAFKGVGGVGIRRSGGGSVGGSFGG